MNDRGELFRQEALEFRARGEAGHGSVIRLGAPWLRWSVRLLLVLVAAGVVAAALFRTEERSTGPAVVDTRNGSFDALFPIAVGAELRSARAFRLTLGAPTSQTLRVRVTGAKPVTSRTYIEGLGTPAQPSLLLSGRILTPLSAATAGKRQRPAHATLVLRSERIGGVLLRQFRGMLGRSGGGG